MKIIYYFINILTKLGNSLALLLFCIVFQIAIEKVKLEFIISFKSSLSNCVMIHKLSKRVRFNTLTLITALLFIDNGVLPLSLREDLMNGSTICINIIAKFSLMVHMGR